MSPGCLRCSSLLCEAVYYCSALPADLLDLFFCRHDHHRYDDHYPHEARRKRNDLSIRVTAPQRSLRSLSPTLKGKTMDQVFQFLFNTNHEMPDIWSFILIALLAYLVPLLARRYMAYKQQKKDSSAGNAHSAQGSNRKNRR